MAKSNQLSVINTPITNLLPRDGVVEYIHQFFDINQCDTYFHLLKHQIQWRSEEIKIFGRWVMQPRLTAWYGDEDKTYRYSGIQMRPLPWNDFLLEIKNQVELHSGVKFNSVLLNYYRHGADSMGWHSDDEPELGKNPVIASVSFGAERLFYFRHKKDKTLKLKLMLSDGSFLLMGGATQHHWQHALPKTTKPTSERINLTFRYIH